MQQQFDAQAWQSAVRQIAAEWEKATSTKSGKRRQHNAAGSALGALQAGLAALAEETGAGNDAAAEGEDDEPCSICVDCIM